MTTTTTTTDLHFKWTISRARDTYGYNVCTLHADGRKVARCNGGGYDMKGTCLGDFIAKHYADRLNALTPDDMPENSHGRYFYGLTFHDPNYDPGKAVIGADCDDRTFGGAEGETVEQAEAEGKTVGLERYQAFYRASNKTPTERHNVPLIDGACGMSSVERIMKAIGLTLEYVPGPKRSRSNSGNYILHDSK